MTDTLPLHFESRLVGTISLTPEGPHFAYDPAWIKLPGAFPISVTMPLSPEAVPPERFAPWAANLLPESDQLHALGQFLGKSRGDVVGILSRIGRDTAGALSVGRPGSTSPAGWRPVPDEASLERIIEELPRKPFLVDEEGVSMSLAGAQSKLGVAVDGAGVIHVPTQGSPSTHILKPDISRFLGSVQNEAFCLVLARMMGLPVPEVTTGSAGKRSYLLVRRYDRVEQSGRWRRVHQEDFCQILGRLPSAKYEKNGTGISGPALRDMFAAVRRHLAPSETWRLFDMAVTNVIACNTDAHAKNYSILIRGNGAALAPLYDVMTASVWPDVTRNLAQTVAGKNRGDYIMGRHWQRAAVDWGFNPRLVLKRVEELCAKALAAAAEAERAVEAMPAGGHCLLAEARKAVEARARTLIGNLKQVGPDEEADEEPSALPSP